uniref:Uncharacterized protein n=1 Tax=Anguilla anguilla TaxID=7936 RepID=A0A0E9RBK6_ANGAN
MVMSVLCSCEQPIQRSLPKKKNVLKQAQGL